MNCRNELSVTYAYFFSARSPCASQPCKNDAVCKDISETEYTCECVAGWTGKLCDQGNLLILLVPKA